MNWTLLQNGIGIDLQAGNFQAIYLKRQWKRMRVADHLEIPGYRQMGPQQCGKLYNDFLRKNGLQSPWTVVALPRSAVLLRWLNFPKAVEKDLARAVEYQLDSLHPFEEGSVYWDFSHRKSSQSVSVALAALSGGGGDTGPDRIEVPVAIAEKKFVNDTAEWFRHAGIGVSQFTVTTAVLLSALAPHFGLVRETGSEARKVFFILNAGAESLELVGYNGSSVSKEIPLAPGWQESPSDVLPVLEREFGWMRSELRLDAQSRPPLVLCGGNSALIPREVSDQLNFTILPVSQLFPTLNAGDIHPREDIVALAAALAAVDRTLPFSLNLLPPERREYQSRLAYVSVYALTAVIVLLLAISGLRGTIQDQLYARYLGREIEALQPQIEAVETAQAKSHKTYEHLAVLEKARSTATLPLNVLNELTRILPADVWLQEMQYDGETASLSGYATSAYQLLQVLAESSYFDSPQMLSDIRKTPDGKETFRIGVRLKKAKTG